MRNSTYKEPTWIVRRVNTPYWTPADGFAFSRWHEITWPQTRYQGRCYGYNDTGYSYGCTRLWDEKHGFKR